MPDNAELRQLLEHLHKLFGATLEYGTVVCLSQRELGDPQPLIEKQQLELKSALQELRIALSEQPNPHPLQREQLAHLEQAVQELQDVFTVFGNCFGHSAQDLDSAVSRYRRLWMDWNNRLDLLAIILPLPAPLPRLSKEQEHFQGRILDSLFERFDALRQASATTLPRNI